MSKPQECAGCGCEIDEGLAWHPLSGQAARLCCNKRCLARAQRRYVAERNGSPLPRRLKQPALPPAEPIQPEDGWGSLSHDVLCQLAAHMPARDLLAAALTCKHWRSHLTRDVTKLELRVDDASWSCRCGGGRKEAVEGEEAGEEEGEGEEAAVAVAAAMRGRQGPVYDCGLVRSAARMLPQVRSLTLTVFSKCFDQALLLRHMHALAAWTQLRHLVIDWDVWPDELNGVQDDGGAKAGVRGGRVAAARRAGSLSARRRRGGGGGGRARRVKCPSERVPEDSVLCPMGLGALGLLTGLESLSISADFKGHSGPAGLFGLSSLERLTCLQLLQADTPARRKKLEHFTWSTRDADLAALTSLECLRLSAQLLSPALLGALTAATRLTHLAVLDLPLAPPHYRGFYADSQMPYGVDELANELGKLRNLQRLEVEVRHQGANPATQIFMWSLQELARGMKQLTKGQLEHLLQQQQQQQPPQQPVGPRRRHRRHAAGSAAATNGAEAGAAAPAATAAAGPVKVFLSFGAGPDGDVVPPEVLLDDDLLEELSGVVGLSRLDLRFREGAAAGFHRLSALTNLTHLGLRCSPQCRPSLEPTDLQHLITCLPALTSLALELPASCLNTAALSTSLYLATSLRELELHALPHVRKVPYDRWQVRTRLLLLLRGDAERRAAAVAEPPLPPAAAVAEALQPLMFLQQLFMSMRLSGVREALQAEAEWRQQAAAQQQAAAAEAANRAALQQLHGQMQALLRQSQTWLQEVEEVAAADAAAAERLVVVAAAADEGGGEQAILLEEEGEEGGLREEQERRRVRRRQERRQELIEALNALVRQLDGLELVAVAEAQQRLGQLYQTVLALLGNWYVEDSVGTDNDAGEKRDDGDGDGDGRGTEGQEQLRQHVEMQVEEAAGGGGEDAPAAAEVPAPAVAASVAAAAPVTALAVHSAAAAAVNAFAAAAAPALAADQAGDPAGGAAGTGAGAIPTLAAWVLCAEDTFLEQQQQQQPTRAAPDSSSSASTAGSEDTNAAADAADAVSSAARDSVADAAGAVTGAATGAATGEALVPEPPGPPPIPLHELSLEQLGRLRAQLVWEELVVGPDFRIDAWTPPRLEVLRLRGFAGLDLSRMGARAGGAGAGAGAGAAAARCSMPYLGALDVVLVNEAAAAATRAALADWAAPGGGRAPQLVEMTVTAAAAEAVAASPLVDDDF